MKRYPYPKLSWLLSLSLGMSLDFCSSPDPDLANSRQETTFDDDVPNTNTESKEDQTGATDGLLNSTTTSTGDQTNAGLESHSDLQSETTSTGNDPLDGNDVQEAAVQARFSNWKEALLGWKEALIYSNNLGLQEYENAAIYIGANYTREKSGGSIRQLVHDRHTIQEITAFLKEVVGVGGSEQSRNKLMGILAENHDEVRAIMLEFVDLLEKDSQVNINEVKQEIEYVLSDVYGEIDRIHGSISEADERIKRKGQVDNDSRKEVDKRIEKIDRLFTEFKKLKEQTEKLEDRLSFVRFSALKKELSDSDYGPYSGETAERVRGLWTLGNNMAHANHFLKMFETLVSNIHELKKKFYDNIEKEYLSLNAWLCKLENSSPNVYQEYKNSEVDIKNRLFECRLQIEVLASDMYHILDYESDKNWLNFIQKISNQWKDEIHKVKVMINKNVSLNSDQSNYLFRYLILRLIDEYDLLKQALGNSDCLMRLRKDMEDDFLLIARKKYPGMKFHPMGIILLKKKRLGSSIVYLTNMTEMIDLKKYYFENFRSVEDILYGEFQVLDFLPLKMQENLRQHKSIFFKPSRFDLDH